MTHELFARKPKYLGVLFFSRLQPYLKRFRGIDILRQLSIVESEDHFVVNEHIRTTGLVLEIFNFPHQPLIVVIKAQFAVEFAANECLANKEFTGKLRIMFGKGYSTLLINREAVKRSALQSHDLAAAFFPMRLAPGAANERPRRRFDPLGLDVCNAARKELRRFNDLARKDPSAALFGTYRSRPNPKFDAASSRIGRCPTVALDRLASDIAEQS